MLYACAFRAYYFIKGMRGGRSPVLQTDANTLDKKT